MSQALGRLITVLAVVGLPAIAAAEDKALVITSVHVDHATKRLVISGQNLTQGKVPTLSKSGYDVDHPIVTLDLQPLTVLSSSPYQVVLAPLSPKASRAPSRRKNTSAAACPARQTSRPAW